MWQGIKMNNCSEAYFLKEIGEHYFLLRLASIRRIVPLGVLNVSPPGECQFQPYLKISHCAIVKTIEINMARQIWR